MAGSAYFGPKWGGAVFGSTGGVVTWNFATAASSIYQFDMAITDLSFQAAVRAAFDTWEKLANIDFVETASTGNANIILGGGAIDGPDGVLGEATMNFVGANATHSEVVFDIDEYWSSAIAPSASAYSLYVVAVHEIGHAIGLDHTSDPNSIMYPYIDQQFAPNAGDVANIQALYGASLVAQFVRGTEAGDYLSGGLGADTIFGDAGADTIDGLAGDDLIFGGRGVYDDVIRAGDGADQVYAGEGRDSVSGDAGNDVLGGGQGADVIDGGAGRDTIYGGVGADPDSISGGTGDDRIFAGDGNDTVWGGDGNDEIGAGTGADVVKGGAGNDIIYLGLNDGAADIYQTSASNGADTIYAFENGRDHIDMRESGIVQFAQLSISSAADGDAVITFGGGQTLTLDGVRAADIDASDFIF